MTQKPIFSFLCGNSAKYFDLTVNAIKFLRNHVKNTAIGVIFPPGDGDVDGNKVAVEKHLKELDEKIDVSDIYYVEGKKNFDWSNSQYILSVETFAANFDPVIFLDSDTVVLRDLLPFVNLFLQNHGDKKFGFLSDFINSYDNFKQSWEGELFIPQFSYMLFRSAYVPQFFEIWRNTWKEWIEPAPFVQHKDPARYFKGSILAIPQYALGQSIFKFIKNLPEEVCQFTRTDLKICRNLGIKQQETKRIWLASGSSFSHDGNKKIKVSVCSARSAKSVGYVAVNVGDRERKTAIVSATQSPVWNENFDFDNVSYSDAADLSFALWSGDATNSNSSIVGTAEVSLLPYRTAEEGTGRQHFSLPVLDASGRKQGVLEVDAEYYVEQLPPEEGEGVTSRSVNFGSEAETETAGPAPVEPQARKEKKKEEEEPLNRELLAAIGKLAEEQAPEEKKKEEEEPLNRELLAAIGKLAEEQVPEEKKKTAGFFIKKAKVNQKQDVFGKGDPFVVVKVGLNEKRTNTIKNTQNPVWNEVLSFKGVTNSEAEKVTFTLYDEDTVTNNDLIGTATLSVLPFLNKRSSVTVPVYDKKNTEQGTIVLNAVLAEGDVEEGDLDVGQNDPAVAEAEPVTDEPKPAEREYAAPVAAPLPSSGEGAKTGVLFFKTAKVYEKWDVFGKGDPYVLVKVGTAEKKTAVQNNTQTPVWNERLCFSNISENDASKVGISLWDYDAVTAHDFIGEAEISLLPYKNNKGELSLAVFDKKNKEQAKIELEVELQVEII